MLHEVNFQSVNERDLVHAWIYVPAAAPTGIVQIVHGFGEHSRRYLHMIVRFLDAGYIVAADDQWDMERPRWRMIRGVTGETKVSAP